MKEGLQIGHLHDVVLVEKRTPALLDAPPDPSADLAAKSFHQDAQGGYITLYRALQQYWVIIRHGLASFKPARSARPVPAEQDRQLGY